MIRTDLFPETLRLQDVALGSPISDACMSTSMDHPLLDTYDGNTGPDQFSFPVSALEEEVLSNMSPHDLLPFG